MTMIISMMVVPSIAEEQASSFYLLAPLLASIEGIGDDAELQLVDETQYSFPDGPVMYINFAAAQKSKSLILYARPNTGELYACMWEAIPDKLLWYVLYIFTGNYDLIVRSLPDKEQELTLVVSMGT